MEETVTIPKREYDRPKEIEEEREFLEGFEKSLDDLKHGRGRFA